jgi:hypothetical protein
LSPSSTDPIHARGVALQTSKPTADALPSAKSSGSFTTFSDAPPPPLLPRHQSQSQHPAQSQPQSTPFVKIRPSPTSSTALELNVVETVEDDIAVTTTFTDDDSIIDMFHFEDNIGLKSMEVEHINTPCTDDIALDNDPLSDPALDEHEGAFCKPTTCRCCSLCTAASPINDFLSTASIDAPAELGHENVVRQVFANDGEIHEFAMNEIRHREYKGPRAHLDDGTQATTTHHKSHLFAYRAFTDDVPCQTRLVSADGHRSVPQGYGILRIPAPNSHGYVPIFCFYTPDIPSCIVSPSTVAKLLPSHRQQGTTLRKRATTGVFTFTVHSNLRTSEDIVLHGILDGNLCYTEPLILPIEPSTNPPSSTSHMLPFCAKETMHGLWSHSTEFEHEYEIYKLSVRADRLLWHQRLGHCRQ